MTGPTQRQALSARSGLPPFQAVLDEHAADVMGVLRGAVGGTDAEDCFQETFLAALRAYPQLDDARNLRSWLMTIAHRKAIDHHRANGRRPVPMAAVDEHIGSTADAPAGELDVNGVDGIWLAVRGLPPKQRAAVALRYACDLPHTEIAAALGCSPDAARRSLHEGMKRLRRELA